MTPYMHEVYFDMRSLYSRWLYEGTGVVAWDKIRDELLKRHEIRFKNPEFGIEILKKCVTDNLNNLSTDWYCKAILNAILKRSSNDDRSKFQGVFSTKKEDECGWVAYFGILNVGDITTARFIGYGSYNHSRRMIHLPLDESKIYASFYQDALGEIKASINYPTTKLVSKQFQDGHDCYRASVLGFKIEEAVGLAMANFGKKPYIEWKSWVGI